MFLERQLREAAHYMTFDTWLMLVLTKVLVAAAGTMAELTCPWVHTPREVSELGFREAVRICSRLVALTLNVRRFI